MAVASGEGQIVKGLSGVLTTVAVTAPLTGDGTAGNPIGISPATDLADGSLSAADHEKLSDLPDEGIHVAAPLTGDGSVAAPLALSLLPAYPTDPTLVRYVLLDYDGGDDASTTYFTDQPAGTDVSGLGLVPLKTMTVLRRVLPPHGNGLRLVVLVKPRAGAAAYLKPDAVTVDDLDLRGFVGYQSFLVRGSDFTNSAADYTILGAVQKLAGPGGGGAWTCSGVPTASVFTVAAGALTAEPALIGYRVRFDPATTTVALRNACGCIQANTAGQITLQVNLPAAPVAGDLFYIETMGVVCRSVMYTSTMGTSHQGPDTNGSINVSPGPANMVVAGMVFNAAADVFPVVVRGVADSFYLSAIVCSFGGAFFTAEIRPKCGFLSLGDTYPDEAGTVRTPGFGLTTEGEAMIGGSIATPVGYVWERACSYKGSGNATAIYQDLPAGNLGQACYWANGAIVLGGPTPVRNDAGGTSESALTFGSRGSATLRAARMLGPFVVRQAHLYMDGVDIQQAGSRPAIQLSGVGVSLVLNAISGGTGNTGVSLDLTGVTTAVTARRCTVVVATRAALTIASAGGDIRLALGAIATFADLSKTNVVDFYGNDVEGPAGYIVAACGIVTNKSGGALAVGQGVTGNGTAGQVKLATGNSATIGDSSLVGVIVTAPANNGLGYITGPGLIFGQFDGTPTPGAIAYLSPGTPGAFTTTIPALAANNNRLRCGRVFTAAGTIGFLLLSPENLAVVAPGTA